MTGDWGSGLGAGLTGLLRGLGARQNRIRTAQEQEAQRKWEADEAERQRQLQLAVADVKDPLVTLPDPIAAWAGASPGTQVRKSAADMLSNAFQRIAKGTLDNATADYTLGPKTGETIAKTNYIAGPQTALTNANANESNANAAYTAGAKTALTYSQADLNKAKQRVEEIKGLGADFDLYLKKAYGPEKEQAIINKIKSEQKVDDARARDIWAKTDPAVKLMELDAQETAARTRLTTAQAAGKEQQNTLDLAWGDQERAAALEKLRADTGRTQAEIDQIRQLLPGRVEELTLKNINLRTANEILKEYGPQKEAALIRLYQSEEGVNQARAKEIVDKLPYDIRVTAADAAAREEQTRGEKIKNDFLPAQLQGGLDKLYADTAATEAGTANTESQTATNKEKLRQLVEGWPLDQQMKLAQLAAQNLGNDRLKVQIAGMEYQNELARQLGPAEAQKLQGQVDLLKSQKGLTDAQAYQMVALTDPKVKEILTNVDATLAKIGLTQAQTVKTQAEGAIAAQQTQKVTTLGGLMETFGYPREKINKAWYDMPVSAAQIGKMGGLDPVTYLDELTAQALARQRDAAAKEHLARVGGQQYVDDAYKALAESRRQMAELAKAKAAMQAQNTIIPVPYKLDELTRQYNAEADAYYMQFDNVIGKPSPPFKDWPTWLQERYPGIAAVSKAVGGGGGNKPQVQQPQKNSAPEAGTVTVAALPKNFVKYHKGIWNKSDKKIDFTTYLAQQLAKVAGGNRKKGVALLQQLYADTDDPKVQADGVDGVALFSLVKKLTK